jgi:opacity protein-like surface antigen
MTSRLVAALAVFLIASPAMALTPQGRTAALDHIANLIEKNYVFKDKASAIAAEVRGWKRDSEVLKMSDERRFASLLMERLRKHDRHFAVSWSKPHGDAAAPPSDAEALYLRQSNYGFDKVERLAGNVGYVRMSYFCDFDTSLTGDKTPAARKAAEAVLAFVQNSDAVIIDLRRNGGGSPAMIDLLLSAFFGDKPVLLNRFYERAGDKTQDFTTLANFTGLKRAAVPLFVLISGRTASAAEEFSYDVKTQKRGLIVGETSYGGANPGEDFDAGGGFSVFISTGTAINPITGKNWEGVGVEPDIAVPASDALSRAHAEALQQIIAAAKPGTDVTEMRWALEQAQAEVKPPAMAPLTDFVGLYGDRTVALKDGALFYNRPRAAAFKLVALSADTFGLAESSDARLIFKRDGSGRVESVTLADSAGGMVVFDRKAAH